MGTVVDISGENFADDEDLTIEYDGDELDSDVVDERQFEGDLITFLSQLDS